MSLSFRRAGACFLSLVVAASAAEFPRGLDLDGVEAQRLTIGQALEMMLQNNLEVRFNKVDIKIEQARTRFATGVFDPVFRLEMSRESLQRPDITTNVSSAQELTQIQQLTAIQDNTFAIQESTLAFERANNLPISNFTSPYTGFNTGTTVIFDQDTDRFEASLGMRTPLGTQFALSARQAKIRSTFDGDTRTITPFYTAFGGFEVRQPLLKDFGPAANLSEVRTSRINERVAALNWEKTLSDALASVFVNYFDMLYAQADLRVKQDAAAADEKLAQQNQRRLELGFMSPIDVQQARAQVSVDHEQMILAKNLFMERQFALRRLITSDGRDGSRRVYLPVELPNLQVPEGVRETHLQTAFRKRPDYTAAVTDAEKQDIRLAFARNQAWPSLDLVGTFGYNGLGDGWADARDLANHSQAPQWSFGIQFSMPLGRVQARAQLDAVKGFKEQSILKIKQSEVTVTTDVDTALSRIELSRQSFTTARQTRELYEEAVRIALRRLEEGQISSFDILEQQRKLYDARSRELSAQAQLNKNIVTLWAATGTVLENTGVTIVTNSGKRTLPETVRNPVPAVGEKRAVAKGRK